MNRKMYWGIAALIVFMIAAGGFIYWQWSQVQQLKEEVAQDNKRLEEENKPVAENDLPTPDPGFKWVPHGDHFHEVPIDAPDVWQGDQHAPIVGGDVSTKELALPADEGKPLDEDFYRESFSREELESMLKSKQRLIEKIRTVSIPRLEESREKVLGSLQLVSDAPEYAKKSQKERLAFLEEQINWSKGVVERGERQVVRISKVLKEEGNNVEK